LGLFATVQHLPLDHACSPLKAKNDTPFLEKTCAVDAVFLSSGMSKDNVCVESMESPFGKLTLKGSWYLTLCWHGALNNKKCPVHPKSTIAVS
jgi:hypothetical protein